MPTRRFGAICFAYRSPPRTGCPVVRRIAHGYRTCYSTWVDNFRTRLYCEGMTTQADIAAVRAALGLSQEQMARIIGVSFSSVNRWEGGHSAPVGGVRDLYAALAAALAAGISPSAILKAANNERGLFLFTLFKMAYGGKRKAAG